MPKVHQQSNRNDESQGPTARQRTTDPGGTRNPQHAALIRLQQAVGNQAVQRSLAGSTPGVIQRHMSADAKSTGNLGKEILKNAEDSAFTVHNATKALELNSTALEREAYFMTAFILNGRSYTNQALNQAEATACSSSEEPPVPATGGV